MGKLMEKAGGMLKKEDLVEKGRMKRAEAGADVPGTGSNTYGSNTGSNTY
jgi:hypothetical protein